MFLNVDCFSRLVNGAVLPPSHNPSPSPSPSPSLFPPSLSEDLQEVLSNGKLKLGEAKEEEKREGEGNKLSESQELDFQQQQLLQQQQILQQQILQQQIQQITQQIQHPVDTRWLTSLFSALLLNESKVAEGALLWELIYPKGKDGRPVYSPSGKYLFRIGIPYLLRFSF